MSISTDQQDHLVKNIVESKGTDVLANINNWVEHIKNDNQAEFYDKWAETYDEDVGNTNAGYNCPQILTKHVSPYLKKEFKILDIGAGTGLLGTELKKLGITDVDGLDCSAQMLEKAKLKKIYNNYFCEFVTEERLKPVEDNTYDAVISAGSFAPGHLSSKCLRTIGRPVKPGGFVAIGMRQSFLRHPFLNDFESVVQTLIEESFWKLVKREVVPLYYQTEEAAIFILQRI